MDIQVLLHSKQETESFIDLVLSLALPLEQFHDAPPPPRNIGTSTIPLMGPGRRPYAPDLDRAIELHDLGNSWEKVAEAMGVHRGTMYNHLKRAGISSGRPVFTEIDD
jgi:hypothetical protein